MLQQIPDSHDMGENYAYTICKFSFVRSSLLNIFERFEKQLRLPSYNVLMLAISFYQHLHQIQQSHQHENQVASDILSIAVHRILPIPRPDEGHPL